SGPSRGVAPAKFARMCVIGPISSVQASRWPRARYPVVNPVPLSAPSGSEADNRATGANSSWTDAKSVGRKRTEIGGTRSRAADLAAVDRRRRCPLHQIHVQYFAPDRSVEVEDRLHCAPAHLDHRLDDRGERRVGGGAL